MLRWIEVGPFRNLGGGRHMRDSEMEEKMVQWIKNYREAYSGSLPSGRLIRLKAKSAHYIPSSKPQKDGARSLSRGSKRKQQTLSQSVSLISNQLSKGTSICSIQIHWDCSEDSTQGLSNESNLVSRWSSKNSGIRLILIRLQNLRFESSQELLFLFEIDANTQTEKSEFKGSL